MVSLVALAAQGQSILTVAGGGTLDGLLATDIRTDGPRGLAFDRAGNLYVAVRYGGYVLRIDATTGVVTVVAGNGASGFSGDGAAARSATLRQPRGIVLDANDNVFIADTGNSRVRRIDAKTGIITTYAGGSIPPDGSNGDGGQATAANLGVPWGLAIDRGYLYITDQYYNTNNVRRVNMTTGVIDTIAGSTDGSGAGFGGDGGPAKNAQLNTPYGIVADSAGNLYIADSGNARVRRIDTAGIITTYAGGGIAGNIADGIKATDADLAPYLTMLAFDKAGNLVLSTAPRLIRIDKTTQTIATLFNGTGVVYGLTRAASDDALYYSDDGYGRVLKLSPGATDAVFVAGGGFYVGDGLPATAAVLHSPQGLAQDAAGNIFIADPGGNIIRRISAADGTISTVAGVVGQYYSNGNDQEGIDATKAGIGFPLDVAIDAAGNLYICDEGNRRIWRVDSAGKITTYAGGGSPADGFGDGGPANGASFDPMGITLDSAGNLYITDNNPYDSPPHARVRRVDAVTKIITTVAGTSAVGFAGDGGQATAAQLNMPYGVVIDNSGNVLISEYGNGTIRKVDRTGVITTIAGDPSRNEGSPLGDEGQATAARVTPLHMAINRKTGDLIFSDHSSHRVRRIDPQGIIHTVAGSDQYYYEGGFGGDNGPATAAKLSFDYGDTSGVTVSAAGDIMFSDSQNNRVRAVFACVNVSAPQLTSPANNATATIAPTLSWNDVKGAFRYDVKVDTVNPPQRVIASDLTETAFTPSLAPGTKYFWSVTAKGDAFCPSVSTATSAISAFTTASGCGVGAFDLTSPADGATSATLLAWQAAPGVGSYDLYLGTNNPPPLFESGLTGTTHGVPNVPGQVFWFVVAHAACDATKTATTPIRSYTATAGSLCGASPSVTLSNPANGANSVATNVSLAWSVSQISAPLDVYFGTTSNPPLLRSGIPATQTSLALPPLDPGVTYYWRVVGGCSSAVSSPTFSFTTQTACNTPQGVQIVFAPAAVNAGATYTIVWSVASGLDVDGGYLVERSTSASFSPILDAQVTSSTAASFIAGSTGTVYHRVRAIPACDPTKNGPLSDVKSVSIANTPANIIFTVQPAAVVTSLGDRIEDRQGTFTLENIGATAAQVIVGQSELPGSKPFFSIAEGGAFITLQPRRPRSFTIQYSGPPNNTAASYQGVIFVTAVGSSSQLAVTPYAFVNLKVGGAPAVAPQFIIDGVASDYAAFQGFGGADDSNRPGRDVSIRNPGSAPMDLAAEIGPDVWLVPENGWNSQPLAPGATRSFKLKTARPFAASGSPLPRYTYFTVRTKDGVSSRLLVQDNDQLSVSSGRSSALDVSLRSFIVPDVAKRLRLTNNGGDSVQVELIFTPSGADGFDAGAVRRVVIVVPPNDVVTLVDPVTALFGGTTGQIEVRVPRERLGLILVSASIPVVTRGEGARVAAPHVLYIPAAAATITLSETSGVDKASVRLVSDNGQTVTQDVTRYGTRRISVNAASRWDINVDSGGGSVVGLATIGTFYAVSRPATDRVTATSLARAFWKTQPDANAPSVTTVVPVIAGSSSSGNSPSYRVAIGLVSQSTAAQFLASFYPSAGGVALNRTINVGAGQTTVYNDVMRDLFAVTPADGNLFLQGPPNGKVYAVLQQTAGGGSSVPASSLPLPTTLSEALTSATSSSQRPLYFDGLEQSVDSTRGTRWMLLLNEVGGAPGFVNVRLYESGNRTSPIATKDLQIASNQQVKLDTVFAQLGLDAPDRQKDRTNVEVVVTATAGTARVAASVVSIDNQSGDTKVYALTPMVGSGNPNINFATPVVSGQPVPPPRHRGVHH